MYDSFDKLFEENIPDALSEKENINLFIRMKLGEDLRSEIIVGNIRIVLSRIYKKFLSKPYEKADMVSVGCEGLISAVDTFDIDKGYSFSTYAAKCIDYRIVNYMKKQSKYLGSCDIDELISIHDDTDLEGTLERDNIIAIVRSIVNSLPERKKYVIIERFGFKDDIPKSMPEIASNLGVSKQYIYLVVKETLALIEKDLIEKDLYVSSKKLVRK